MAKKVVQPDGKGKPVKKKKHGCRNCLLSLLVFIVILGVAGYFTGDFFTKKYLNMSLWNCFGVIHDLRSANGKKIVKNRYADSDYAKFDSELKQQMFLKDDVDFGVDKLITALTDSMQEDETGTVNASGDYLTRAAAVLNAGIDANGLTEELTELYVRENLDLARLRDYEESKHDTDYVLKISDKMLAAAVNKSLDTVANALESVANALGEYNIERLSDVARLDQIIFGDRAGSKDGVDANVKTVTVTLSVNVRKVANTFIKEQTGRNLGFLTKLFLPKRLYITAVVPAESNATVENNLYVNNMNDKKMNRAYKLIRNITGLTGEELDLKEKIATTVNDSVGKAMEKINGYFPLDKAENGTVPLDMFEMIIDVAKLNENSDGSLKEESLRLTSSDLIYTIAGVVASEADDAIVEEYDFMHQYREDNTGKVVYVKTEAPGQQLDGKSWVDYKQLFMEELSEKYMLDLRGEDKTEGTEDDITFEQLMRLFGLGEKLEEEKELELIDLFDGSRLGEVPEGAAAKVQIDSRMLGAVLQSQIDTLIKDGGSLGTYNPSIEYVITYKTSVDHIGHTMLRAAISIDTADLLSADNAAASIVTGLIGSKAVITFDVDITPEPEGGFAEGFAYIDGKITYNGLTVEKTGKILKTIGCFVEDFDRAALLEQIETPMRDAIGRMNDVIEIELCSSRIDVDATVSNLPVVEESAENRTEIALPTVFETVKQMMFADDDENNGELNKEITAQGIEDVLRAIDEGDNEGFEQAYIGDDAMRMKREDGVDAEGNPTDIYVPTYEGSFAEILEKYYIKGNYTTFNQLFGEAGITNTNSFSAANFDFEKLYYENRSTEAMRPFFEDNDLAALILEKMQEETSNIYANLLDVKGLRIDENSDHTHRMTMYVRLQASDLLDDANADKTSILPAQVMYLKATVYLDRVAYYDKATGKGYDSYEDALADPSPDKMITEYYVTELTINDMDEDTYGTAVKMMQSLNGSAGDSTAEDKGLNLDATARDIGAAIKGRFADMEESLGCELEFVQDGVKTRIDIRLYQKVTIDRRGGAADEYRIGACGVAGVATTQSGCGSFGI